jgi:hypothetical protein
VSLKSGEVVPIRKTTSFLSVDFNAGVAPSINTGQGWKVLQSFAGANESILCLWQDEINVAGIQAADLSMINTGTAIARRGHYLQTTLYENLNTIDIHVISVSPLNWSVADWNFLIFGYNANTPMTDDRIILVQGQSWKRGQQDASFTLSLADTFAFGGVSEFSTDRLYLYRMVAMFRNPYVYVDTSGPMGVLTPLPFAGGGVMAVPETQFVQAVGLEEFNSVSTAYAIYRGNELDQSFDN